MTKYIPWMLALFFSLTCFVQGINVGVTITPSSLFAVAAMATIIYARLTNGQVILSKTVLLTPVVISTLMYVAIGIISGAFAENKDIYTKEVAQRLLIIVIPLYIFVNGPRRPQDFLPSLLAYLVAASVVAVPAVLVGAKSGFRSPVYMWDLHKNAIGAESATMSLICIALILANQFPKHRRILLGLIGLSFMGMVAAQARASMVGVVLATFLMLLAIRAKPKIIAGFASLLIVASIGLATSLPKESIEHAISNERLSSNGERFAVWTIMWDKMSADPFICTGWGNKLPIGKDSYISDAATIFFYDWAQMSIAGLLAQIAMVGTAVTLAYQTASRCPRNTTVLAVALIGMGIIVSRFFGAYLDTFWVGRGPALTTFAGVGMVLWVHLWLKQTAQRQLDFRTERPKNLAAQPRQ